MVLRKLVLIAATGMWFALLGLAAAVASNAGEKATSQSLLFDAPYLGRLALPQTLSYSYRRIQGRGLRKGTNRIATADAFAFANAENSKITQVPFEMDSDIHILGLEHAPFSLLTVAIELPLVSRRMQQRDFASGGNPSYTTHSFGVGDLEIVAVVPFMEKDNDTLDFHLGLRLPTGEISNKGNLGSSGRDLLPVSMQSGSRTTSILGGLSFQGEARGFGWGVNGASEIGFGDNSRGYRHGNSVSFTGWLAHDLTSWFSGSLRLAYDQWFQLQKTAVSGFLSPVDTTRISAG